MLFILCAVLYCHSTTVTYAYTKEEVEAAKAWLSGHGYSPDAAGAAQAYQDYLNGKFGGGPERAEGEEKPEEAVNDKEADAEEIKDKEEVQQNDENDSSGSATEKDESKLTESSGDETDIQTEESEEESGENKELKEADIDVIVSTNSVSGQSIDETIAEEMTKILDSADDKTAGEKQKEALERPENAYDKEETVTGQPDRAKEVATFFVGAGIGLVVVGIMVFLKYFRKKNK